jgi:hypothetical protein
VFKTVLRVVLPVAIAGALTAIPSASQAASSPGWRITAVLPDNSTLMTVAATSARNAWTGGTVCTNASCDHVALLVRHWTGKTWTVIGVPKADKSASPEFGVSALAPVPGSSSAWILTSVVTITKQSPTTVLHWTGTRWGTAATLAPGVAAAVAPSSSDAWAFGADPSSQSAYAAHFNGKKWASVRVPVAGDSASATTPADIWVIGSPQTPPQPGVQVGIMAFNGRTWRTTPVPHIALTSSQTADPTAITAVNTHDVWAAGQIIDTSSEVNPVIKPFLLHWNGARWAVVKVPYEGAAQGTIAQDGRGGVWLSVLIIGNDGVPRGYILHYRNGAWTRVAVPARDAETTTPYGLAWIPGTDSVWGVGTEFPTAGMLNPYPAVIYKYGT